VKTTSSAVSGSPSENVTPRRSVKSIVSPSSEIFQSLASRGIHLSVIGSRSSSVSSTYPCTVYEYRSVLTSGVSLSGMTVKMSISASPSA
jgi:hypothetical protein